MDLVNRDDMNTGSFSNPVGDARFSGRDDITNGTQITASDANIPKCFGGCQLVSFPEHHKTRFGVIERAKRNAQDYLHNPKLAFEKADIYFHKKTFNKNGRGRLRQFSVRKRISQVAQILSHHSSIEFNIFGYKLPNGQFHIYSREKIVTLAKSTYKRVSEVLKLMEASSYIRIEERVREGKDKRYRNLDAIIHILPKFYEAFGITEEQLNRHRIDKNRTTIQKMAAKDYVAAKRELKAIRREIRKVDENPGKNRKRESTPLYRDYTGISKDRQAVLQRNGDLATPTAKQYLAEILQKIKPPS